MKWQPLCKLADDFKSWLAFFFLLAIIVALAPAPSVAQTQEESTQDKDTVQDPAELHWAVKLGLRVRQLDLAIPLIDQVVLVPDPATYLQEIARWSPTARWPVLIEDEHFCSMFIRRFKPSRVLRRTSSNGLPTDKKTLQQTLRGVVIKALGGQPNKQSLSDLLQGSQYPPPGVVITSVDDPAWVAAVALAAGRAQPLAWMDTDWGPEKEWTSIQKGMSLMAEVRMILDRTGLPWEEPGDTIETLTICRKMPIGVHLNMPIEVQPPLPNQTSGRLGLATTDAIGRDHVAKRGVYTGWIFGDEKRCAYVAMCSLFLPRTKVTLVDGYANKTRGMEPYDLSEAAKALNTMGYGVDLFKGGQASPLNWQRRLVGGLTTDLFFMNSRGRCTQFGLVKGDGEAVDVPLLNTPVAMQFIHSYSMCNPSDPATIAGMWLSHGAYSYVGSISEPYLAAFVPTIRVAEKMVNFVPFIISCRWWPEASPFSRPWRVSTFGDPLMLAPSPNRYDIQRVAPPDDGQISLRTQAVSLMRSATKNSDAADYAKAIRLLVLIGEDQLAIEFWELAQKNGVENSGSTAILGPLFRAKDQEAFLTAWQATSDKTAIDRDMLWHLCGNLMTFETHQKIINTLSKNLRRRSHGTDLTRLAPYLERTEGWATVRQLAESGLKTATNQEAIDRYQAILDQY